MGHDNHVDWTAPSVTGGERVGPGIRRKDTRQPPVHTRSSVMNTLLGEHNLVAQDPSGADPYNATGRHFRR